MDPRTRFRRYGAAAFAAAVIAFSASAQTAADIRVRGSYSGGHPGGPGNGGGIYSGSFECVGTPTCRGSYTDSDRPSNCSNAIITQGAFEMTGLDLSRAGPIQGGITFRGIDNRSVPNSDGSCTYTPGVPPDFVSTYTGHWSGTTGTITIASDPGDIWTVALKVELPPVFPMTVRATINTTATAVADIQYRPQDLGTTQSVFVFAMAPATRVVGGQSSGLMKLGFAKDERKADTPIGCVLAQLNAAGQMTAVTSANLAAYLTGVLSAQGASVAILNGVPTGNVSGATFFVGYGTSGQTMINTGVNRAAVTVPGSLTCAPAAPQTGWWWNPLEDGRGFSIEKRGNNLFFAAFLYDISGRSTWYVSSGPVSLDGTLYNGDLLSAAGGQTLGGAYSRFPTLGNAGTLNMTFNNESTGTIVWAGGTVPIQRFNIIPNGLTAQPVAGVPESGWWWNEQEAGRGFFMEWQGNTLDIAGYMYDDNGNSLWYLTVGEIGGTPTARSFSGNWWSYTGGQALTGAWRQNTRSNSNVAPVTITFSGPDTALMTLPNGRSTNLRRHRF